MVPGDEETLRGIGSLLLEECPRRLDELRQGMHRADADLVRRAAHTLKSSCKVFGAARVVDLAFQMECLGRDKRLEDADELLPKLEVETDRLVKSLRDWLDNP